MHSSMHPTLLGLHANSSWTYLLVGDGDFDIPATRVCVGSVATIISTYTTLPLSTFSSDICSSQTVGQSPWEDILLKTPVHIPANSLGQVCDSLTLGVKPQAFAATTLCSPICPRHECAYTVQPVRGISRQVSSWEPAADLRLGSSAYARRSFGDLILMGGDSRLLEDGRRDIGHGSS